MERTFSGLLRKNENEFFYIILGLMRSLGFPIIPCKVTYGR